MRTSRVTSNTCAPSEASKHKGLRTRVRAGDNPGMGPYNGQNTCTLRVYYSDDAKTQPSYSGIECTYT